MKSQKSPKLDEVWIDQGKNFASKRTQERRFRERPKKVVDFFRRQNRTNV